MAKSTTKTITRDPEKKTQMILKAARKEFSKAGFEGARVDRIATKSKFSKGLIYHHFKSKEVLFQAVLEQLYSELSEANKELYLEDFDPIPGVKRLTEHTYEFFARTPEFITLVNVENLMKARHLKDSVAVRESFEPLRNSLGDLLRRGGEQGVFRKDVDPTDIYISIVGLGYFFLANRFTLGVVFDADLTSKESIDDRKAHILDVVLGYLQNTAQDQS